MDKPQLLINIQTLVPQLSLARIQELAELEYTRQLEEIASGMLHKKHIETLLEVIKYMPESVKAQVIEVPSDNDLPTVTIQKSAPILKSAPSKKNK